MLPKIVCIIFVCFFVNFGHCNMLDIRIVITINIKNSQ